MVQTDVAAWDEFSGRLEAIERVELRSRVAGTVQAVHFREGALVKAGDLLVTHRPGALRGRGRARQAQVAAAQARVAHAQQRARARRAPVGRAAPSRSASSTSARMPLRKAEANLRAAQAALQTAQLNLGYTQVRAPIAGRIGRIEVTVGNLVAAGPGAPVLTTLVSVSPIYASFDADEQVVARALKGLPGGASARAQIERIPVQMGTAAQRRTRRSTGRLQLVDNQVDARSGTVRVRAVFDNKDGPLMPGQFARLRMGQAHDDAGPARERARGRHRPEQELRDGGGRRQQGAPTAR